VQQREQKRAAHKKEERLRRRERREKKDEGFRLHEQQGLPPGDFGRFVVGRGRGRG
jgi:hypothetical protein